MPTITASVGIANGRQCYNVVSDQLVVINLLNRLPGFSGGTREQPLSTSPRWGVCSEQLHQAILTFQNRYSLSQDGHVDPGGRTIRALNAAVGDQLPAAGPDTGKTGGGAAGTASDLDLWTVDDLSLTGFNYIDGPVGGGYYFGSVSFSRDSDGSQVSFPLRGGGPAAGLSVSVPTKYLNQIAPLLQKAVKTILNAGVSASELKSWTQGKCIPLRGATLSPYDFTGVMTGFFLGGNVTVGGVSGYGFLFGLPNAPLLEILEYAPRGFSLAKGMAFIGSEGLTGALGAGVSLNDFQGIIG